MKTEDKVAKMKDDSSDIYRLGKPSVYVCPECSGTLFKMGEGKPSRYRCRVGHAYSKLALIAEQAQATEGALWAGMRALREQVDLLKSSANEYPTGSTIRQELINLSRKAEEQAIRMRNIIENDQEALVALRVSNPRIFAANRRNGLLARSIRSNTETKRSKRHRNSKTNQAW